MHSRKEKVGIVHLSLYSKGALWGGGALKGHDHCSRILQTGVISCFADCTDDLDRHRGEKEDTDGRRIFRIVEDLVEDEHKWPWAVSYKVDWPFRLNSVNSGKIFTKLTQVERKSFYCA